MLSCALDCFAAVVSNNLVFAGLDFERDGIGLCCDGFLEDWEEGPPALLLKFSELAFTSGWSSAGSKGRNEVVPNNGIDRIFHSTYRLVFACTCVFRLVSLHVPLSRNLIEFGMPE